PGARDRERGREAAPGARLVRQPPPAGAQHHRPVPADEGGEGGRVVGGVGVEQLAIAGPGGGRGGLLAEAGQGGGERCSVHLTGPPVERVPEIVPRGGPSGPAPPENRWPADYFTGLRTTSPRSAFRPARAADALSRRALTWSASAASPSFTTTVYFKPGSRPSRRNFPAASVVAFGSRFAAHVPAVMKNWTGKRAASSPV